MPPELPPLPPLRFEFVLLCVCVAVRAGELFGVVRLAALAAFFFAFFCFAFDGLLETRTSFDVDAAPACATTMLCGTLTAGAAEAATAGGASLG